MWATFLIAGAFFLAFIAVGYFGVKQREEDAERQRARGPEARPDVGAFGASRGGALTSDQVVFELEQRIDEELRDIDYALHAPERCRRLFEA